MGRVVRRIGIAIGSLMAAALAVPLVAGVFLGSNASGNPVLGLVILVLGGLIYRDIIRREQRSARARSIEAWWRSGSQSWRGCSGGPG